MWDYTVDCKDKRKEINLKQSLESHMPYASLCICLCVHDHLTTLPASWEICMQVKKQQLEQDMEQQTGSKLGKEYVKAVYCHPAYLTYMQSTSPEMPGWNQDCWEKYQ